MRMGAPTRRVQQPPIPPPPPPQQQQGGIQEGHVNRPLGIGNRNVSNNKPLPRHEVVIRQGVNANGNPVTVMNQSARPIRGTTATKRGGGATTVGTAVPSHQQQQQSSFLEALNSQTSSSQLSNATSVATSVVRQPTSRIPVIHPQSSVMNNSQDEFDRELLRDLHRFRSEQRAGQAQTPLGRAAAESSGFINIGLTNLNLSVSPLPTPLPLFNESTAYYTPMQCYAPFVKSPSTEVRSRPPAQRPTQIVIDPQNRQQYTTVGVTQPQRSRSHHRSMTPGSVTSSVALNDVMAQQNFFPTSTNPPPSYHHHHLDDDEDDDGVDLFTPGNRAAPPPPPQPTTTSHQAEVADVFNPLSRECLQQSIQHWKVNPFTSSVYATNSNTTSTSPTTSATIQSMMAPIMKKNKALRFPSTLALVCPAKALPHQHLQRRSNQHHQSSSPSSSKYKTPSAAPTATSGVVSDASRTAAHYVTTRRNSSPAECIDANNMVHHNGEKPTATTTPACSEPTTARRVAGRKTPRDDSRYGLHKDDAEDGPRPPHTTSSRVVSPVPINAHKTTLLLRNKVLKPLRFEVSGIVGMALGNPHTNGHPAVSNPQLPYNVLQKAGNAELTFIQRQMRSSEDVPVSPLSLPLTDDQLERNMFDILKQRLGALSNRVADARDGVVAVRGIEMSLLENLERLQQL